MSARPELALLASRTPGRRLLVLYGSRARGDAHDASDWDLGWLGAPELDAPSLVTELVRLLDTEAIDLVDLARASGKLRFDVARDGVVLFEDRPGRFEDFQLAAAHHWCEVGPIIQAANRDLLDRLEAV